MTSDFRMDESVTFEQFRAWTDRLGESQTFGVLKIRNGRRFLVMEPERLIELDAILSNPAVLAELQNAVSDALHGRTVDISQTPKLLDSLLDTLPCDESLVLAVKAGVQDALQGRTVPLGEGTTLDDLAKKPKKPRKARASAPSQGRASGGAAAASPARGSGTRKKAKSPRPRR